MNVELRKSWDERAERYSNRMDKLMNSLEYEQQWQRRLQRLLGSSQGLQILDVATGSGFLAVHLAQLGHRVTGLDFSAEMLRIAESKAKARDLECSFVYGCAEKLPFITEQFDAIVCRNLLGSLSDRQAVFKEWRRVLKPGGRVFIWDGDWKARNLFPFAQLQLSAARRKPRRQAKIKQQGAVKRDSADVLYSKVTLELEEAGFIQLTTSDQETKLRYGKQEANLQCEPLFIIGQKRLS